VLSAANQHSLSKLCSLQKISIHCQNCVRNESTFIVKIVLSVANRHSLLELCCSHRINICYWNFVLSAANQHSLLKLYCSQRINIRCRNCVVCDKLVFVGESVLSAANPCSVPKLCYSPRISIRCWNFVLFATDQRSLLKLCWSQSTFIAQIVLQQIRVRCRNCVFYSKSAFATESVFSAANPHLLPKLSSLQWICDLLSKLSCLQRISIRCRKVCWLQQSSIHCRNWGAYGETVFAAELHGLQWPVFVAELCDQ